MYYKDLAELYIELEKTSKRLEKTFIISGFLKKCSTDDLKYIVYLIQGKIFPLQDERKIGFSSKLVIKAIGKATGISEDKVLELWKKKGDLGKVAQELIVNKKQMTLRKERLTAKKVFDNIRKLPEFEGKGAVEKKISLVVELLNQAEPLEACYIVKTVLEELRVGIGEGTLRDAILWAYFSKEIGLDYKRGENKVEYKNKEEYNRILKSIQQAYDLVVDYSEIASFAKKGNLEDVGLNIGRPFRVMLAILVKDVDEAFEALGRPAQFEFKLDGFRIQIHKSGKVELFTRNLENVTKQFPDIVEYVKKNVKKNNVILDGEIVGYNKKSKRYLPFQNISQRIKRKYDIDKLAEMYPVELNLFDILYYNNKVLISKSLAERRKILEGIVKEEKGRIVLTRKLVTDNTNKANEFYKDALDNGTEGLVIKNINSLYRAGRYVNGWCKLKPTLEHLDLVIVGAEYGSGKRVGFFSSFILACKKDGKFLECGMMGSGIKEKESEGISFKNLTKLLKPYIIAEKGKLVSIKPKIVVEVEYEEIQKSPTYSSGYALRFPRFVRIRNDKHVDEASSIKTLEKIYKLQRGRS